MGGTAVAGSILVNYNHKKYIKYNVGSGGAYALFMLGMIWYLKL
jgi:hypothetical protein